MGLHRVALFLSLAACYSGRGIRDAGEPVDAPPHDGAAPDDADATPHDATADLDLGADLGVPSDLGADADLGAPTDLGVPDMATLDGGATEVRASIFYVDPSTGASRTLPSPAITGGGSPDTSCFGHPGDPGEGAATTTIPGTLVDLVTSTTIATLPVDFFPADDPSPDVVCGGTCTATSSDGAGATSFADHVGSWYAYRAHARTGADMAHSPVVTVGLNRVAATGTVVTSVSMQTLAIVPTVLGLTRLAGTTVLMGTVSDCVGRPVQGLVVRVFRSDGTLVAEPPDGTAGAARMPAYRYSSASTHLPSATQPYTDDGGYYAINIPLPSGGPLRIEAWMDDVSTVPPTPRLWACEHVAAVADGVTITDLPPYRSDGPSDCTETRP